MRDLFEAAILLNQRALARCHLSYMEAKISADFNHSLCRQLLQAPLYIRGRYSLLLVLAQRCGVDHVLTAAEGSARGRDKHFVPSMLSAVQDLSVRKPAADLVIGAATLHLEQLLTEDGKEAGLIRWQAAWLTPLVSALCGASVPHFRNLMEACAPKLLAVHPASLAFCLAALDRDLPAHVRTFVGLLQASRTSAALRNTPEVSKDASTLAALKAACSHADAEVRLAAFATLCSARKESQLPTEPELGAVRFFLQMNAEEQSSGFVKDVVAFLSKLSSRVWPRHAGVDYVAPFLQWLWQFSLSSVRPINSYQRRYLGFLILKALLADGQSKQKTQAKQSKVICEPKAWRPPVTHQELAILLRAVEDDYEAGFQPTSAVVLFCPSFAAPPPQKKTVSRTW